MEPSSDLIGRLVRHTICSPTLGIVTSRSPPSKWQTSHMSRVVCQSTIEIFWFVRPFYIETVQSYYLFQGALDERYLMFI